MLDQASLQLEALRGAGVDRLPQPRTSAVVALASALSGTEASPSQESANQVAVPDQEPEINQAPSSPVPGHEDQGRPPIDGGSPPSSTPPKRTDEADPKRKRTRTTPITSAPSPLPTQSLFDNEGFEQPELPVEERAAQLQILAQTVAQCAKCAELAATRTNTVFADGSPTADLMIIGEAPGADEDRTGVPFVGRAGQLLNDMLTKGMGLRREDVYIANILKCRPPGNRNPEPDEAANCIGYLHRQIELVRPKYLCLLGAVAAQRVLETVVPIGQLRKRWHRAFGTPAIATYHPAYLLRNPEAKKKTWEDLQRLMKAMGLPMPNER